MGNFDHEDFAIAHLTAKNESMRGDLERWMRLACEMEQQRDTARAEVFLCADRIKNQTKMLEKLDVVLARIGDDIADKTCPLADVWWWDDDTTMAAKIAEVLE